MSEDVEYQELLTEESEFDDIKYSENVSPVVQRLLKNIEIFDSKPIPFEKLQELSNYERTVENIEANNDEKFVINKILVMQQEKYYTNYPFPEAYTKLAKRSINRGEIEYSLFLYEKASKFSHSPMVQKIAKNALGRNVGLVDEKEILSCIKTFDDAITTVISFRKTRAMRYEFVVQIADIACDLAITTQDKFRVAVEYKRLKQTEKAKALLTEINNSKLVRGKIQDVVYAATLRKEKAYYEAEALYRKVLEAEPRNPYAKVGLAALLKDIGQYDEAYELCNDVLQKSKSSSAAKVLAVILQRTNNVDLARKILINLEKLYYKFDPYRYLNDLIDRYVRRKDLDGATRITKIRDALKGAFEGC